MSSILLYFRPDELSAAQMSQVQSAAPDLQVLVSRDQAVIQSHAAEIEIVAGHFSPTLLAQLPNLRWAQQWGAGVDWLMRHPDQAARDFMLTNASGVHAVPISEHIMAMLLMFARGLHHAARAQADHRWWRPERQDVFELEGKTMLLIGIGAIGSRTAQLALAHGMRVEAVRRDASVATPGIALTVGPEQLTQRLPHADVVVLTTPLTNETRHMINTEQLRAMRSTAYLINIGRGGTVNQEALIQALREGWIAGAGLDVFEAEPLPESSPLWSMENVIITSHYAGNNPHYNERAIAIFLDNLGRYQRGEDMRNLVDKRVGY